MKLLGVNLENFASLINNGSIYPINDNSIRLLALSGLLLVDHIGFLSSYVKILEEKLKTNVEVIGFFLIEIEEKSVKGRKELKIT